MKRLTGVALAAVMLLPGCANRQEPEVRSNTGRDAETSRIVSIYEAVIRRLVTTGDSTFGPDPQFPVIYLLDRAKTGAADPESQENDEIRLSDAVKRQLLTALSDLPIEFVTNEDSVVTPPEEGGGVKREGVVVTIGPVPRGDEQVEVEASLYAGPLAGTWLTYVVKRSSQGWRVTGTTGPVAIS